MNLLLVLPFVCSLATVLRPDLPVGHWETQGFKGWTQTGTAFSGGPALPSEAVALDIHNVGSDSVITSKRGGDSPRGTLTSPPFKVERDYLAFRISGGDYEYRTCFHLLIDGKVACSATGWNNEFLSAMSWDLRPYRGKHAQVQVVDEAEGDWAHINVDRIVQTDYPERLPLDTGTLYHEALRPQFHFTSRQWAMKRLNPGPMQEGWSNDLNGLIYYDGEYHLFVQRWYKCWLHAVSKDLIHWTELPPAFWEEELEHGDQSGTCVVDYANTSGLSADPKNPPMVAFWSRANNRDQCLSYSLDHGRTWTRYAKNPFMVFPERDPKVFWYAPDKHWVMIMYGDSQYHIFTSPNLLDWTNQHHPIPNSFECPDFFELPVDGDPANKKWVLIQGNGNYSVGTFDGTQFKEETPRHACDLGPNFYATQSWADLPGGRRVQAAWMRGADFPDMPFNQMVSFPCELTLHTTPDGLRIFRQPVKEIENLHLAPDVWPGQTLTAGQTLKLEPSGQLFDIRGEVSIPAGARLILNIRGVPVTLTSKTLDSGANGTVQGEVRSFQVLVDRASIEAYVNGGELSATRFTLMHSNGISVRAEGGPVEIRSLTVYPLKSIWE